MFGKKKFTSIKNPFFIFDESNIKTGQRIGRVHKKDSEDIIDFYDHTEPESDFLGKSISDKRLLLFFSILVLGIFILFTKAFYLQILSGSGYLKMAEKNRIKVDYIKTTRGLIYDRNGVLLVKNVPTFNVVVIPSELPFDKEEKNKMLESLSKIINVNPEELHNVLDPIKRNSLYYYQPIIVKDSIGYTESIALSIKSGYLSGVYVETDTRRQYLNEDYKSLSHILGYVGKITEKELENFDQDNYLLTDYTGKNGVEKTYEQDLRGMHGKIRHEVDAYGTEKKILEQEEKKVGSNIVLTIDVEVQKKLEEILGQNLKKNEKSKGAIVAMNPNNGEILGMVSLPTYDNNDFAQGISMEKYKELIEDENKPLFFRPISGTYPSGSTFKLIMAAAALQEGVITENTSYISAGGLRISQWFFPDWRAGGHGRTNVVKALADSVNTFFYIVGGGYQDIEGMGLENMVKYSKLFGLGKKLGIDLPNEASGFVPTQEWKNEVKKEPWYIGDTYHFAIGQGDLLVTPLQVASYTATVANGGVVYRPRVVKEVINPNNQLIHRNEAKILESGFVDQKNMEIVQKGLRQGVTTGSARRLYNLPIQVAGKTGTAQWSTEGDPHAWFTSYAPYENPEIVLTVLIEEGEEGSTVAVPVAEDFYRWWAMR